MRRVCVDLEAGRCREPVARACGPKGDFGPQAGAPTPPTASADRRRYRYGAQEPMAFTGLCRGGHATQPLKGASSISPGRQPRVWSRKMVRAPSGAAQIHGAGAPMRPGLPRRRGRFGAQAPRSCCVAPTGARNVCCAGSRGLRPRLMDCAPSGLCRGHGPRLPGLSVRQAHGRPAGALFGPVFLCDVASASLPMA